MGERLTALTQTVFTGTRRARVPAGGHSLRLLWIVAAIVGATILLPTGYLLIRILGDPLRVASLVFQGSTLKILGQTAWLAAAVTGASALLAVLLAWLTTRTDLPLRRLWAILTPLPVVLPSYVAAYLMVAFFGPRGMLAGWTGKLLGIHELPSLYGFPGAFILLTLLCYPYTLLSARAALQGMDPALEEAARGLGYGPWKTFWRVTLPQLRPALASGSLLVALYVLRDFGAVSILRYDTFTRAIYLQYKSMFDRSAAAGLASVLVVFTLALVAVDLWTRGRARYTLNATGSARPPTRVALGRWRWPALLLCAGTVAVSLAIPLAVLLYWLGRGLQAGERLLPLWQATQNSLLAAAAASGITLAAALPVAVLSARFSGRASNLLERIIYTGFALPGIVVALALVFFGANYIPRLYQTLPMLLAAYLILSLPQMVGAARASLLQIPTSLEEAARGLGRRPWQAFVQISLPLARPGVLAGAALVFLTTLKELPATLILSPLGFKTLATLVWSAVSEAFFAQAAAPALLIVLAASVPMAFLILKERT